MVRHSLSARIANWFRSSIGEPTPVQRAAWPQVLAGRNCLISAGTGQGKTLAALLPLLDERLNGPPGECRGRLLYISPLRALSSTLADGLGSQLESLQENGRDLHIAVRTGDTSRAERCRQLRRPPDLLLTTPESLFVLLGSRRGRTLLGDVRAVVVDEVHALLGSKRGAHLALSLERLEQLQTASRAVQRIGLSATARPLRRVARYLVGAERDCKLIAPGPPGEIDLHIELGPAALGPFAAREQWAFVLERLSDFADRPGKTLVFCNTRALVERLTCQLAEVLGAERVAAHHGSLGERRRAEVELALRRSAVEVVVCSATLELGIDIGQIDRVCQIGSVASLNAIRQRAGRSRHRPGERPQFHLFPLNTGDLLDACALGDALERGVLEPGEIPSGALDVLAQQIVAMVASGMDREETIHAVVRRAAPWSDVSRADFEALLSLLHDGYVAGRDTGRGPILRLANGRVHASESAPRLCLMNAGTLPEWFDYEVYDAERCMTVGHLDEEFGFESSPGDVIQLGGVRYRIERIAAERIEVRPCSEAEATLPFWLGEGPGRSALLSAFVSRRMDLADHGQWPEEPQLADLLRLARAQLGALPTRRRIVLERFFDPGGDEHVVIHALFGQRINRAWGLALRKRFCRQFNFELQAAVTENAILISLGATHSFNLEEVVSYLHSRTLRDVLVQALLDTPRFATRFRWCANTALAIPRRESTGRVPAQIQRNQAENLIARVFPDQLACLENLSGPRQVPDHPLVRQALRDCLEEAMDTRGLERIYQRIEAGRIDIHSVDTPKPSVLAQAAIHAPRHGFLDPAPAEERRTRSFESAGGGGQFQLPEPTGVFQTAASGPEALETRLLEWRYLPARAGQRLGLERCFLRLVRERAAASFWADKRTCLWIPVDALAEWLAVCPGGRVQPLVPRGLRPNALSSADEAMRRLAYGAIKRHGRVEAGELARETGLSPALCASALIGLQREGRLRSDGPTDAAGYAERRPGIGVPTRGRLNGA